MEPHNYQNHIITTPTPTTPATNTTNNTPPKSSKALLIGTIVCAILAIGGISFGIYKTVSTSDQASEISDLKSDLSDKATTIATLESELAALKSDQPTSDPSETPTTPYNVFADNLIKNFSGSVLGSYYHYDGSNNIENFMNASVNNGHLEITDLNNNNQKIAEAGDVISVYFIKVGNGGVPYFYIINKDGSVSRIDISENSSRAIEKVGDYSNIVSVVQGSDLYAWLIDINGNIYKTS